MYVLASADLAGYDLNGDTLVENIDEFLSRVVIGDIDSQKIVVDEDLLDAIDLLEGLDFKVVLLHSYLKFKQKIEDKEQPKETETVNTVVEKPKKVSKPKKEKVEKQVAVNNDEGNLKGPLAFFARLFGGKGKKEQVEDLSIPIDKVLPSMRDQLSEIKDPAVKELFKRGRLVKTYCVNNKYLTIRQIEELDAIMNENIKYNRNKRFIQCARENGYLDEDQAADVLSHIVNKEIISKTKCKPELLYPYNVEFINLLKTFFIYKIDEENKKVYVCKDCAEDAQIYILEKRFMDYDIVILNVIEGVTAQVVKELKAFAENR